MILEQPQRFSVDIDIIVSLDTSKEELETYLSKIVGASAFTRMLLDERRSCKEGVPKAHYIFYFQSNVPTKNKEGLELTNPEREVLLDVLFAENHYPTLVERPIKTEWLQVTDEIITVKTPDINSIAGDKLTAFAPETAGVPYHRESVNDKGETIKSEMFMEIIKQAFDVGCLFNLLDNINTFKKSYEATAISEIKYRPEKNITSIEDVLKDTIATALLIARKDVQADEQSKEKFKYLNIGLNQFGHFVYTGNFRIEQAQVASAKAAYLADMMLSGSDSELKKFNDKIPLVHFMITHSEYNYLNKRLKFVAKGEALFYWNEIVKLLPF